MSGSRPVLLDSVILIDHLNGIRAATGYLRRSERTASITVITRAEVLAGLADADWPMGTALLDRFETIPIDAKLAERAARLRRVHGWKLPDALQAAAALERGLLLATRNTKDFPPEDHSFVRVPYTI